MEFTIKDSLLHCVLFLLCSAVSWSQSEEKIIRVEDSLVQINSKLRDSISLLEKVNLLLLERELEQRRRKMEQQSEIENLKFRFNKAIELIRLLYEKTLDLDHYYSSTATFQEISSISNPNNYAEFQDLVKDLNRPKSNKDIKLPELLNQNIYTSIIHKFLLLFTDQGKNNEQISQRLKNAECILDFSLSLTNNLNTIYYESEYLRRNNLQLIDQLEQLFGEFSNEIGYEQSLDYCREKDQWDILKEKVDDLFIDFQNSDGKSSIQAINLEFIITKLVSFVFSFNLNIDNARKYYEKFQLMLENYRGYSSCHERISDYYEVFKSRISLMINKFEKAYKLSEVNGSFLKAISYGE